MPEHEGSQHRENLAAVDSAEIMVRLAMDNSAWSFLVAAATGDIVDVMPRIKSVEDVLAVGFLSHQGLLAVAPDGAAITDRGEQAYELLKDKEHSAT